MAKKNKRSSDKASSFASRTQTPSVAHPGFADRYRSTLVIIACVAAAATFHFLSPNMFDADAFFYIRLASIHRTRGLFDVDFQWMPYAVVKDLSSSLWYGFGVFLIPFTYFDDLAVGLKSAGVLLTAGALWSYYLVARRSKLRMAPLWPLLLFFSAPNVTSQFLMIRPQLITLGLAPVVLSYLATPHEVSAGSGQEDSRSPVIPLFLASLALTWFHLNFAWLLGLILAVVTGIRWLIEKRVPWRPVGAIVVGAVLGWLLRPDPLGAARLLYVQVVEQMLAKQAGIPLLWGNENLPLPFATLVRNFIPLTTLWTAAIVALAGSAIVGRNAGSRDQRVLLWSSLTLSFVCFLLTVFVGRRSYDLWAEFGILFVASVFTYVIPSIHCPAKTLATWAVIGVSVFVTFDSTTKTIASLSNVAIPPDRLSRAALWLAANSRPGDVVFNVRWWDFSSLFFWNQQNHFIGGLDPIFQYAYDKRLYWKYHHLAAKDSIGFTCGAPACVNETREGAYEVLTRDFNATYVVLVKQSNPGLYAFFERDHRFEKTLDTSREAVYRIRPNRGH